MVTYDTFVGVALALVVVASGVVGAVGASVATQQAEADRGVKNTDGAATDADGGVAGIEGVAAAQNASDGEDVLECGGSIPADRADPESDVRGWENGYWYAESIDVDQSDGVSATEREAIVSRTMARVEAIRCIEFNQSVPVSVMSRETFREQGFGQRTTEGLRTFDNAKFEALFLVNESADSIAVQERNRGSGVLGYYSPQRDEIVVIAESNETLRIDELTLAHELVHAWQDQQYNLSGSPFAAQLRDQVNARNGLIEGDASYTETLYERRCDDEWTCLDAPPSEGGGALANIGVYLLKFQPYSDGPAFVRLIRNVGGWDAVNAVYREVPASTEQVIHPLRYRTDPPTNVTLEDATTDSWERVRPPNRPGYGQLGEAALMMMFVYPFYHSGGRTQIVPPAEWFDNNQSGNVSDVDPLNYESDYSAGWDGDRLHVYENESGALGYVWRLSWDSPQQARQFVEGYRRVLRYWGGERVGPNTWRIAEGGFADAFYVTTDGRNVTIVNAPTVEQLSEVRTTIDPEATSGGETGDSNDEADDAATETTTAG